MDFVFFIIIIIEITTIKSIHHRDFFKNNKYCTGPLLSLDISVLPELVRISSIFISLFVPLVSIPY